MQCSSGQVLVSVHHCTVNCMSYLNHQMTQLWKRAFATAFGPLSLENKLVSIEVLVQGQLYLQMISRQQIHVEENHQSLDFPPDLSAWGHLDFTTGELKCTNVAFVCVCRSVCLFMRQRLGDCHAYTALQCCKWPNGVNWKINACTVSFYFLLLQLLAILVFCLQQS